MSLPCWILVAVIAAALFGLAMFQIGKSQHEDRPTDTNKHAQAGTNEANQENSSDGSKINERNSRGLFDSAEKHSGIFLVIVTVLLVIVTGFLWKATRDLVREAKQTAERQLRAYICVSEADVRYFNVSQATQAVVHIKNSGQTPAYEMTSWYGIAVGTQVLPRAQAPFPASVLGPNSDFFGKPFSRRPPTQEEYDAVISGKSAIYVYGEINYRDAFNVRRFTRFRYIFRGSGTPISSGATLDLAPDDEGNEAN